MLNFTSLELSQPLLDAIAEQGYDTPTPIQARAIPAALKGLDILGCAQTGTGKTAAFSLPILHRLHTAPADKSHRGPVTPRALILSPTRELAGQIEESFLAYGRHTGLRLAVVYGGVKQHHQVKKLQRGVDILVATPGRLLDLMQQGHVDLRNIKVFVLDEADRMLDMGFIQPIRRIASAMPKKRQTKLFSATMPDAIRDLANSLLYKPVHVKVAPVASAAPLIDQSVYMVASEEKLALLQHLLAGRGVEKALVFTRTKYGADKLTRKLNQARIKSTSIHGNKAQNQRQRALDAFRNGQVRVLVATDVAARGLDVDDITHVFNYELPAEPEAYVHRIGRTGRAGATGIAIAFCDNHERTHLRSIERLTNARLKPLTGPSEIHNPLPAERRRPDGPKNSNHNKPSRGRKPRNGAKPPAHSRKRRRRSSRAA